MKNIKNALKLVSIAGLIWSVKVISMDVTSSAPGTPAGTPAPSESQTLQEMAQMKGQYFPSVLPRELVGEVDKYLYMPQIINEITNAIESASNLAQALDNIDTLSPDVLDKADKDIGKRLKEKFNDQIDLADSGGWTPLYIAAFYGHEKVVQELLEARADKDKAIWTGATPLYTAAYWGHEKVVQILLAAGANKDKADNYGETPLFVAAKQGHFAIAKMLE